MGVYSRLLIYATSMSDLMLAIMLTFELVVFVLFGVYLVNKIIDEIRDIDGRVQHHKRGKGRKRP
jgi:hypothetical protein